MRLSNGDTAIAGLQYSYLPSWISFLADRQKSADSGRMLIDAVHDQTTAQTLDERTRFEERTSRLDHARHTFHDPSRLGRIALLIRLSFQTVAIDSERDRGRRRWARAC